MSNQKAVVGAVAVALLAAILLPVLFGDPADFKDREGGDWLRNVVFDFQTLITGLCAVGAATWTISVMEKTDARQEKRHRELVELGLRSERLKIERALYPQIEELDNEARQMRERYDEGSSYSAIAWTACARAQAIERILSRSHFRDGSDYFPGMLNHLVFKLGEAAKDILPIAEAAADHFNGPPRTDDEEHTFDLWEEENNVERRLRRFLYETPHLINAIKINANALAEQYGIEN